MELTDAYIGGCLQAIILLPPQVAGYNQRAIFAASPKWTRPPSTQIILINISGWYKTVHILLQHQYVNMHHKQINDIVWRVGDDRHQYFFHPIQKMIHSHLRQSTPKSCFLCYRVYSLYMHRLAMPAFPGKAVYCKRLRIQNQYYHPQALSG